MTAKQQALLGTFAIIAFLSLSLLLTLTFYRQSVPRTSRPNMMGGLPASNSVILPTVTTFAYRVSHTPLPFPGNYLRSTPANDDIKRFSSADLEHVRPREFSRLALCSFAAAVARSNNIPVPFFANLIWQESGFNVKVISRAGAQGIAQFMPRTAVEFDLLNPFDPIHALSTSGNLLRKLYRNFGNLGLAAATVAEGMIRAARRTFSVLTVLDGEHGVRGRVGAVQAFLNQGGIAATRTPSLSTRERVLLDTALGS